MSRTQFLVAPLAAVLALGAAPALRAQTPIAAGQVVRSNILHNAPLLEGRWRGKDYLYRAEAGEYLIRAMSLDPRDLGGSFNLLVERGTPPVRAAAAGEMDAEHNDFKDLEATDPIDSEGAYYDQYTYRGPAGKPVMITMRSGDFDTALLWGEMRGGEFRMLADDDDSGGGHDARLIVTPAPGTTYAVRATTNSRGETGSYVLSGAAVRSPGTNGASFTGPALPRKHTGRWMTKADLDVGPVGHQGYLEPLVSEGVDLDGWYYERYRYHAHAGERLRLTTASDHVDAFLTVDEVSGGTDHLRTGATLRRIAHDDNGGGPTDAMIEVTFPREGQYIVTVTTAIKGQRGSFRLWAERI